MRLVMTIAAGSASAILRLRPPRRFHPRRRHSETCSILEILPSATTSFASGSIAYRSRRKPALPASESSTSLTDVDEMSIPTRDGALVLKMSSADERVSATIRGAVQMLTIYIKLWQQVQLLSICFPFLAAGCCIAAYNGTSGQLFP